MKYILLVFIALSLLVSSSHATITYDNAVMRARAKSEALKLQYRDNPFQCIRDGKLKIKTKAGTYEQLILSPIQKRALDEIEEDWFAGRPIRYLILKARQVYISTLIEAVLYVLCAFQPNQNALILADDLKGANYLFDMSKLYQDSMKERYPFLVPNLKQSNEKGLKFDGNRSQIIIETGDNKEAGRKYTFRIVHISEAAFIANIGTIMAGLSQSVPKLPQTIMILETTGNGVGEYFHTQWVQPENEYCTWKKLFYGWFENPEYTKPFASEEEESRLRDTIGIDPRFNQWKNEEITLQNNFGCTLEQLNWRRWTIANDFNFDIDLFHQEHPSYPEQAYLVSGRPRFDAHRVKEIYEYTLTLQPQTGYFAHPTETELTKIPGIKPDSVLFHNDPRGEWTIWEMPDHRCEYVEFCDPAGGEEIEGSPEGKKGDFNCIHIFKRCDLGRLEQVAEYRSRIDPDLLADEAYLGWEAYFNPYCVGVEVTGVGRTTADHLKHKAPVYRREVMDEVTKKVTRKLGWSTDVATRKTMIDEMAAGIRDGWLIIRSTVLASECRTFVKDSKGKYQAQEGCFDDCVMCCAGAIQMHLRTPMKSDMGRIKVHNPGVRG